MLSCQPVEAPTLPNNVVVSLEGAERETWLCVQEQQQGVHCLWGVYSEAVIGTLGFSESYEVG